MNALTASRRRDSTPAASGDASLSNPRPRSWMRRTTSGGSSRAAPSSSSSRSWKLVRVSPMRVSRLSASMSWSEIRSPARAWTESLSTIGVTAAMNGSVSSTVRWTQKPRIDTRTARPVSTTSTQAPTRRNRLWDGGSGEDSYASGCGERWWRTHPGAASSGGGVADVIAALTLGALAGSGDAFVRRRARGDGLSVAGSGDASTVAGSGDACLRRRATGDGLSAAGSGDASSVAGVAESGSFFFAIRAMVPRASNDAPEEPLRSSVSQLDVVRRELGDLAIPEPVDIA